jgi:tetratricopeptide (TPR) repeat protein
MKKFISVTSILSFALVFLMSCVKPSETLEEPAFFVPQDPPPASYTLEAGITVEDSTVYVKGTGSIVFHNSAKKPLTAVALEWSYDAKSTLQVLVDEQELVPFNPKPVDQRTRFFQLPRAYRPNEKIVLDVRFALDTNLRSDGDISLQRWYPFLWWDGLPIRSSFRVKLDIPEGFAPATSGRLNPDTGDWENPGVTTNFGLWLFRNMQVEERDAGGVQVRAFFSEEGKECALLCLETAVDVIRFYKDIHGIFPFDSLTIIPGASRPMGGYPYASSMVVIHGQQAFEKMPELHWKWITAHEIGHQYWGEYVMSAEERSDYTESWLMIGMGIFADRMYVESRGLGDDKHNSFFNRFLEGIESYYDITSDAPETLKAQQKYDRNNILIHGKGYSIISALRSVLGDEVFKTVYFRCVEEYGGKRIHYRDIQQIAEEESGENLQWFFDQWVRSSRYLCYRITDTESRPEGDGYLTEITVEPQGESIVMPVEVKAVFKDGSNQSAKTELFSRQTKIVFRSQTELAEVELDPKHRLAILEKPLPVIPEELPDKVRNLPYNGSWDKGMDLFKVALDADVQDYQIWFKLGMVVFEGGYFEESFICFDKILTLEAPDDYHFMAVTWKGNIRDAEGRRKEAVEFYRKALLLAPESGWRHDQFGIQSSREWIEERLKSPYDWKAIVKKSNISPSPSKQEQTQ